VARFLSPALMLSCASVGNLIPRNDSMSCALTKKFFSIRIKGEARFVPKM
jgi:hypothetical protein